MFKIVQFHETYTHTTDITPAEFYLLFRQWLRFWICPPAKDKNRNVLCTDGTQYYAAANKKKQLPMMSDPHLKLYFKGETPDWWKCAAIKELRDSFVHHQGCQNTWYLLPPYHDGKIFTELDARIVAEIEPLKKKEWEMKHLHELKFNLSEML